MRQQGGGFYWFKILIILAIVGVGFFCGQKVWASVLINEVQVYPTGNRFIELYNSGDSMVDLTGWSVKRKTSSGKEYSLLASSRFEGKSILPQSYFLLTSEEGYSGNIVPDVLWAKSNTIAKDNTIILYDKNQGVVDRVGFGLSADCENVCALNPNENYSIQRNAFIDTNNNNVDFFVQSNPNPQNSSSAIAVTPPPAEQPTNPPESNPAPNETATSTNPNITSPNSPLPEKINKLGDVVINEFVSDPADNEAEWIELLNKSGEEIDLRSWRLEEGSKAKTGLSGVLGAGGDGRYRVIEKPAGNLNNAGDLIVLYDASGKIIDQVAYGNWTDGNLTDNAPAASDPGSVARKFDGYNTFNNANDFAVTLKPTKGAANIIEAEAEVSLEAKAGFDFSNDVYFSEILPNPMGDDTKLEFIEIYNAGQREVNLTGWSLSREDDKKINLEKIATGAIIKAGEYRAFYRPQTKIVLRNDQGEVKLFQPLAEKAITKVEYKNVKEGWSYNETEAGWVWSETITPDAANVIKAVNHAPEVEFNSLAEILMGTPVIFDSSDTFDQDDDTLKYAWDFGDGFKNNLANPQHTYFKPGIYEVKLEVSDGKATSISEKNIRVVNSLGEMESAEGPQAPLRQLADQEGMIINEIMPDPAGADAGNEWLELKNQSQDRINLLNWRLENTNGKYKFKDDLWLETGDFHLLNNAVSKLAFKNSDDVISLYDNSEKLVDQTEYIEAVQGEAYARGANNKWFWTTAITPGEENIISLAGSQSGIRNNELGITGNTNAYMEIDLEKIRELEIGSLVKVKGTVAVEPGILGVQIFYITGSPGLQIYNYKKDFPALKIGDYIEVQGELTQTQGELRLKTKDKNDIRLVERGSAPAAYVLSCDQVNEETVGQLITVAGEITDKNSSTLYLDDGNDEILVYLKKATGIDAKTIEPGQAVAITGILSRTQTGLRLLPRGPQDIVKINGTGELTPQVLGETVEAAEWDLAERDKKMELFKYLLIIFGGVIIVLAGLFIKAKSKV